MTISAPRWDLTNVYPSLESKEFQNGIKKYKKMLDELDRLSQVGNDRLRPQLRELLSGDARERLLERVARAHEQLPAVDDDYRVLDAVTMHF